MLILQKRSFVVWQAFDMIYLFIAYDIHVLALTYTYLSDLQPHNVIVHSVLQYTTGLTLLAVIPSTSRLRRTGDSTA